jgi:hypothetical protein
MIVYSLEEATMIKVSGFTDYSQAEQELLKHRYGRKLLKLYRKFAKKNKIVDIHVEHYDWCPFLNRTGYCTCDAKVSVMSLKP